MRQTAHSDLCGTVPSGPQFFPTSAGTHANPDRVCFGWTPTAWRNRLQQLAERCEGVNPERASDLRQAAELMTSEAAK